MNQATFARCRAVLEALSLLAPIAMFTARGLPHGMGAQWVETASLLLCSLAIAGHACLVAAWKVWGR